jgi:hypothetical protein
MTGITPGMLIGHLRSVEGPLNWIICGADFPAFIENNGYSDRLAINPFTVETAVRSWIDDLNKYSLYHDIAPDVYKQFAFLMHWLSRLKPIPLSLGKHGGHTCRDPLLHRWEYAMVNEIFAVQLGLARLGIDFALACEKYPRIVEELIYQLYFRDANPKQLYMMLELLHIAHLTPAIETGSNLRLVRGDLWRLEQGAD